MLSSIQRNFQLDYFFVIYIIKIIPNAYLQNYIYYLIPLKCDPTRIDVHDLQPGCYILRTLQHGSTKFIKQ